MTTLTPKSHLFSLFLLLQLFNHSLALNSDGIFLLSFKYSILSDPLSSLENWNYNDATPCAWTGVTCAELGAPGSADMYRVTSLVLPNAGLLGSVSAELGKIEHLRRLDLSGNFFNGSLPAAIFNASELQVLSLANNVLSGQVPEAVLGLRSLQLLNLSDNAFTGNVPENLSAAENLTVVCLKSNFLFGDVPFGLGRVEVLDLSSNLLNGSLPEDFGGKSLRYLNLSYNKISGKIPVEFAKLIPPNATVDLSFNSLTGAIPESISLISQRSDFFAGNPELCGKPLRNLCTVPSSLSTPPNVTSSSPAIAAIPKTLGSNASAANGASSEGSQAQSGLKPGTIVGIAVADLAGIGILAAVILYVYRVRKRKAEKADIEKKNVAKPYREDDNDDGDEDDKIRHLKGWSCLRTKGGETTSDGTGSESDKERSDLARDSKGGVIVTVDGERPELELESLLKASAYVLGASSESIVYKALLEDGSALAVRRIGRSTEEKMRDFEGNVRFIAKLRHQNLVRLRGFYWGHDEKLVVYEFVSNGSLAAAGSRRAGSSPLHHPLEVRLKIARGIARGLSYIHEKKHVHGNIKPSNILLTSDMEPIISDFGQERLVVASGNSISTSSHKPSGSARYFGSLRSNPSSTNNRDVGEAHEAHIGGSPAGPSSGGLSPYQAPESFKNLKPSPKWDVFSFGVILLELLTGRVFSDRELGQWTGPGSLTAEDKNRALRLVDLAIRGEVESKEDAVLACLKLGFSCASFVPQKRPSMREALQVLDKIPSTTT